MARSRRLTALLLAAFAVAGCAPSIVINNQTSFPVRVVVSSGGKSEVFSPSPGESSTAEAAEGPYGVYVIPDDEWLAYAKATRKYLNDQLANADNLSGPQLLDVIRRLKEIATRIASFERAAGSGYGCSGSVSSDKDGIVNISARPDGTIVASCK